jgi:DNA mismatch endonuclease (patch repair protein)
MDHLSLDRRSENMRAIKGRDTRPEIAVRKLLFSMGYRYRLHAARMPGKPDLVFPARKKVIFVHGCFWHGHDCRRGNWPRSNQEYWIPKISRNIARDRKNESALAEMGWTVSIVWECELRDQAGLAARLREYLGVAGA